MSDPFKAQLSAFKQSLKSTQDLPQQRRVVASPGPAPASGGVNGSTVSGSYGSTGGSGISLKRPNSASGSTNGSVVLNGELPQEKRPKTADTKDEVINGNANGEDDEDNDDEEYEAINATNVAQATAMTAAAMAARAAGQGNLTMKLMTSSDYIKSKDRDVPVFELETSLGFKVDPPLIKCLSNVDRIQYVPETSSFRYLSLHNIKTGDDLMHVLENQRAYVGLSVKQLRDGWNNCTTTIEQLERENKIIVHKTKKDNSPRHIWLNPDRLPIRVYNGVQSIQSWEVLTGQRPNPNEETTAEGEIKTKSLDKIFYEMWNAVPIAQHDDLVKLLLDNGLKPTNAEPESMKNKKVASVKERKQKKQRRGKVTNIHMRGILKDYSSKVK